MIYRLINILALLICFCSLGEAAKIKAPRIFRKLATLAGIENLRECNIMEKYVLVVLNELK